MKRLSIRAKITLWFSAALIIIMGLTFFVVLFIGNQIIQKTIRDNLIEAVEHNVDEVEYYRSLEEIKQISGADHFEQWGDGYLEIDDDFLDEVNDVYTSLCMSDGTLVYGENPIARYTEETAFADTEVQRKRIDGTLYYIFDKRLIQDGLDGLWLRGIVSEAQGAVQMTGIVRTSLILMPMIAVLAIIGGYLIARRMLKPIQDISECASEIRQGTDLNKRIEIGSGSDELHKLADNFNGMFERLNSSFQTERQFTSDASHELRTPMSVIMAQCELTLEKERSKEEYEEALEVIQRQGRKMSKLINDMLDFTRLELKSDRYSVENINFSELVDSVCTDIALIREKGITLEHREDKGVMIRGNRGLLTRMLTNLISNAYRYGKDNGHIYVELRADEEKISLSVKDDGIGIDKDEQEKIFRRFYQSDNSRTGEGTGLGLSMVAEIVKFHGGEIEVESELGVGSTFVCSFKKI